MFCFFSLGTLRTYSYGHECLWRRNSLQPICLWVWGFASAAKAICKLMFLNFVYAEKCVTSWLRCDGGILPPSSFGQWWVPSKKFSSLLSCFFRVLVWPRHPTRVKCLIPKNYCANGKVKVLTGVIIVNRSEVPFLSSPTQKWIVNTK